MQQMSLAAPMMQNIQPMMQQLMMVPEEMGFNAMNMNNNCYDDDLFNQFDIGQYQQ